MTIYDIPVKTIDGQDGTLEPYRGEALLIVNVASKCGFTPQYAWLESLYQKYRVRGFQILGFPCDQFLKQEFSSDAEIKGFCSLKYNVTFPMFSRIDVNGLDAHPLYQFLKSQRRGFLGTKSIKWNFTKFLVDRKGNVVRRYGTAAGAKRVERGVLEALSR